MSILHAPKDIDLNGHRVLNLGTEWHPPGNSTPLPVGSSTTAVGTSAAYAREDHAHALDTATQAFLAGVSASLSALAAAIAAIDLPDPTNAAPGAVATAAAVGTSVDYARADHVHALADAVVSTAKLADLAVSTAKLADTAVTTAKLASAAVTAAKLAGVSTEGAVGRDDGTGAIAYQRLTLDDIDPAFVISAFAASGFSLTKELGDTIANPAFTAAYNAGLTSPLTINDGTNTDAIALGASASFGYNNAGSSGLPARSYSKTAINGTQTWTLTAKRAPTGPSKTAAVTAAWRPRVYYAITTVPGAYDGTFITGLASSGLQSGRANTYAFGAGASNKKIFMAWPTSFGSPSSVKDANGFTFPVSRVATAVAVTNGFGVVVSGGYDVWASDNFITGTFTLTVL